MGGLRTDVMPIRSSDDIVLVRQRVREWAVRAGFSLVDQTKMVTAASEIARNTLEHGGGGEVLLQELNAGERRGLRLVFSDHGPGIADLERAMQEGFTTTGGLGLGLGGAKRLVNEFQIESRAGGGTQVSLTRWK